MASIETMRLRRQSPAKLMMRDRFDKVSMVFDTDQIERVRGRIGKLELYST